MNAQDLLTYLLNAIALSFITIATIDFITGLAQLWQTCAILPQQLDLTFDCESETVTEPPALAVEPAPKPGSLAIPQSIAEALQVIDIDTLQLRPARKIAKALGIAQKVNGKDQPLSWLKAQIQAKLQQPQPLSPRQS